MEQTEGFKSVDSQIKSLERELALCDETFKDIEQSGNVAEKEIEEHFARCMNSLAARKEVLMREVAQNVTNQRITPFLSSPLQFIIFLRDIVNAERIIQNSRGKLEVAIEVCKNSLKGGAMTYAISPSVADVMWKV
jgi:hypothetical protein